MLASPPASSRSQRSRSDGFHVRIFRLLLVHVEEPPGTRSGGGSPELQERRERAPHVGRRTFDEDSSRRRGTLPAGRRRRGDGPPRGVGCPSPPPRRSGTRRRGSAPGAHGSPRGRRDLHQHRHRFVVVATRRDQRLPPFDASPDARAPPSLATRPRGAPPRPRASSGTRATRRRTGSRAGARAPSGSRLREPGRTPVDVSASVAHSSRIAPSSAVGTNWRSSQTLGASRPYSGSFRNSSSARRAASSTLGRAPRARTWKPARARSGPCGRRGTRGRRRPG